MSEPAAVELQLCGRAQLRCGALTVDLPDAVPGYLLACLGARGDWMLRDELTALFWPEAAPLDGQRSLRVNLNRLRDRLAHWGAAEAMSCERRRVRWLPGSDVTRAREARARGDWQAIGRRVAGPSSEPFIFARSLSFRSYPVLAEWAEGERRALLAMSREAVLRCAAVAPPVAAAGMAARQMESDPGDEELLRTRLQALAALGRYDEVASEFSAFDARLRDELGFGASRALADWAARLGPAGSGPGAAAAASDDTLIGREVELSQARALLARTRLLTLSGLGGVGKTRLARALVEADAAPALHGLAAVLWLPLQDVVSVADIAHRVPLALGLPATPTRDPVARAGQQLAGRVRLLVLDNVEQLLTQRDALHQLLDQWLLAAPDLTVLLTSREPVAHPAELVMHLRALPVAQAGTDLLAAPAVRLLVAQAQRVRPGLDPREHRETLAQIAQRVGGLPLALHIAAQWLRLLSPADVLAALARGVEGLDEGPDESRTDEISQRGIGATLWRSWRLLDSASQRALAALSVWVSPFSAETAVQAARVALPTLARLIDHGLVEAADAEPGTPDGMRRLQLHPLVRSFAADRLAGEEASKPGGIGPKFNTEHHAAHQAHADHVQHQLSTWTHWRTIDQRQALLSIGATLPETMAAWAWALGQGQAGFIAGCAPVLCNYFERVGRVAEGIALYESAEASFDANLPTELAALSALARCRALLLYRDGRFDVAEALALRALAWARRLGHGEGIKANLNTIALSRWMLGRLDDALLAANEARDIAAADGDRPGLAVFSGNIALLHKKRGDYAAAEAHWRDALAVHREVGNWASASITLNNLGNLLRLRGRHDEAVPLLDEALRLCDAYGFAASRPVALVNLAQVHLSAGRPGTAEPLARQALEEAQRSGERMFEAGTRLVLAEIALRGGQIVMAAEQLAPALRAARAINDPANLLEALAGYARWCHAQGRDEAAAQAHLTVMAQANIHAELREELAASALARLPAPPGAAAVDLLVLIERAAAELVDCSLG